MSLKKLSAVAIMASAALQFANCPYAIAGSVTAPAAGSINPDTTFDKKRFQEEVTSCKDLPNFHQVHPFIYRGGEPTKKGLQEAKRLGVKTIIDLRGGDQHKQEKLWAQELGVEYINLPMSSEPPTKSQVGIFLSTVKNAQENPARGSVFVHCAHGSDRTGCMVGIWRVTQDGWSYEDAYKEMRHYWFTPKFTKLSDTVREYALKNSPPPSSAASKAN